jgi:itaconyl-CoA hydratase
MNPAVHSFADLTSGTSYFEAFTVGEVIAHPRGRTVTEMDGVVFCTLAMNTAAGHFDEHLMAPTEFGERIVFGGITLALVLGLAAQDTAENAVRELTLDEIRFTTPVVHGDTLYAFSEVVDVSDSDDPSAGIVSFRHWGVNQRDQVICTARRTVLVRRRPGGSDR